MGSSTHISISTTIGTSTSFPTPTSNSIWLPGNKLVILLLQCDSVITENRNQVSFKSWHVPNHHPNHQYDGSSSPSMLLSRVVEQWADIAAGDPNHHPNHHPNHPSPTPAPALCFPTSLDNLSQHQRSCFLSSPTCCRTSLRKLVIMLRFPNPLHQVHML